jgi:hypothetical protein
MVSTSHNLYRPPIPTNATRSSRAADRFDRKDAPPLGVRRVFTQVAHDLYGTKDVQDAITASYVWLADQLGHITLGLVPTLLLCWVVIAFDPQTPWRVVLFVGHIHGAAPLRAAGAGKPGWTIGAEGTRRAADAFAARVLPVIEDIRASGITTLEGIAAELNARGILTARGDGRWYAGTVKRLLARLCGPS